MAVQSQRLYGLPNGLTVAPVPNIRSKFDPEPTNMALPGTTWTNYIANNYWVALSQNVAARTTLWQLVSFNGGSGLFNSLTVIPGPISLTSINSTLRITSNTTTEINDTGIGNINIGGTNNTGTITIGNPASTSVLIRSAEAGGISLDGMGNIRAVTIGITEASPTAAATLNVRVGLTNWTGFTTASAASQVFTITNAFSTLGAPILVTATNGGSNDAQMTVTRVNALAGSFIVTLKNNGAAALNGDVDINFWILDGGE